VRGIAGTLDGPTQAEGNGVRFRGCEEWTLGGGAPIVASRGRFDREAHDHGIEHGWVRDAHGCGRRREREGGHG
jgi:hypothetical protein